MTILVLLLTNAYMVTRAGKSAADSGLFKLALEEEIHLTVDRISLAIMGADETEIDGAGHGNLPSEHIEYLTNHGMTDGRVVHGPLEEIQWLQKPGSTEDGKVVWRESVSLPEEREINWSNSVPSSGEDETGNNFTDDNGNGLLDERGLAFVKVGSRINVHVTVERPNKSGQREATSKTVNIHCRN